MVIPDIIVNLNSTTKQPRFLKLKVQIEVSNGADLEKVQAIAPRVIDHFQTYLRELRVEDLKGSAGIYRLRQELVRRVNAAAYPVKVTDVLFQEILIQ
jgi:flagellar FliL protein